MKLLKKAENRMAYAKIGMYGNAGSGKTFTAAKFAIGLHQYAKLEKPVAMFDTEPAASFIIPYFEEAGIELYVYDESRALNDLLDFMDEAEQECSIVIIDSITHVWRKLQTDYLNLLNKQREKRHQFLYTKLEFQHWGPVKAQFIEFTDKYLYSKLHCIVCGRLGSIYEYQENEKGKRELITTGTKMASEKDMGYEPSLLMEMSMVKDDGQNKNGIINQAFIEKDRANRLNGHTFNFPTFEDIKPHIEFINIGGKHFDSMEKRNSNESFEKYGEESYSDETKQREIWCENTKSLFITYSISGASGKEKTRRNELLIEYYGTGSWTEIQGFRSEKLARCYGNLRGYLENDNNIEVDS